VKTIERPALKELPSKPYRYAQWERCGVAPDYHVARRSLLVGAVPAVARDGPGAAYRDVFHKRSRLSLRKISARLAEQGFTVRPGQPYAATSVRGMLEQRQR
jgi:hypothetical protein